MKRKIFGIILIGVLVIGLTGCGSNNKKSDTSSKTYILTCTNVEEADNEMEPTTKNTEKYEYTENKILKKYTNIVETEYSSKEETTKRKNIEQGHVDRANNYDGVTASIETVSETKYIVTYIYDIDIVDKDTVFNQHEYLDSNNKFSVNEYKSYYESFHENRNGKCVIKEK